MDRCGSCNRPLRDPRSVELGFGPGCWARLEHTERIAVRARVELMTKVAATPAPVPHPPRRSDSALATVAAWTVGLLLVSGLVMFWRWVLLGLALVAVTAVTGLVIERVQERRPAPARRPRAERTLRREPGEITATVAARPVQAAPRSAV